MPTRGNDRAGWVIDDQAFLAYSRCQNRGFFAQQSRWVIDDQAFLAYSRCQNRGFFAQQSREPGNGPAGKAGHMTGSNHARTAAATAAVTG
jgi:hypothetical protein